MFQPICRLMLIIPLLFAGALIGLRALLFHTPPTNDEAGRFVLSDCAMPCWQGIQPGVTRIDDAILLLNANPWVKGLQVVERPPSTYLYWDWSAEKPRFAGDPHALIPPEMWGQNGVIQLIFIPTSLAYGEVSLLLGAPHRGSFAVSSPPNPLTLARFPNTQHLAVYFDGSLRFDTRVICPINLDLFWSAPVSIAYIDDPLVRSQSIFSYDLSHWLYGQPCNT